MEQVMPLPAWEEETSALKSSLLLLLCWEDIPPSVPLIS